MFRVDIIILLSVLAVARGGVIQDDTHTRIVNGQDVAEREIPYQVALWLRGSTLQCGGSILNEKYVVTAAHCVYGFKAKDFKIFAGTIDLNNIQSVHEVSHIIYHRDYVEANSWINDIALMKVATPFKFDKTVSPVKLPYPNINVYPGTVAVVSGWGRLYQEGSFSKILQKAQLQIVDQLYCRIVHQSGNNIFDTQICAYDPFMPHGSCQGDSGGPLTVDGILVGIVSWAVGCGSMFKPSVYTRVSSYIDWIEYNAI